MIDKEVGELWRRYCESQYEHAVEKDLIRKLVEERAKSFCETMPTCYMHKVHTEEALREFGIDPKEWTP